MSLLHEIPPASPAKIAMHHVHDDLLIPWVLSFWVAGTTSIAVSAGDFAEQLASTHGSDGGSQPLAALCSGSSPVRA